MGIDEELIKIVLSKNFGNSVATSQANNWLLKILYYADLRTLPLGIGSLDDRITDVRDRMPKYSSRPDFEDLVNACREIELQLQAQMKLPVSEINDQTIEKYLVGADDFEIVS